MTTAWFPLAHKNKRKHKHLSISTSIRTYARAEWLFDSILDTSSPQPDDKEDGGRRRCLLLMLVHMSTPFSLVKANT